MDHVIETIRAALVPGAGPAERAAGVSACRTVLAALEATPGQPMHATPSAPPSSPIATVIGALRNVPGDQLLDLIIARLRAALPSDTTVPPPEIRFRLPAP